MSAVNPGPNSDHKTMRQFLEFMTFDWRTLDKPVVLEISAIAPDRGGRSQKSCAPDDLEAAIEWAVRENAAGRNIYVVVNPKKAVAGNRTAKDDDIVAAFFQFADLDDPGTDERIKDVRRSGAIVTGTTPHLRQHLYWRLEGPVTDLDDWTARQKAIARALGADNQCVNPARLMRLPGSVSHPGQSKQGRGYATELVTSELGDERFSNVAELRGAVASASASASDDVSVDDALSDMARQEHTPELINQLKARRNTFPDREEWLHLILGMHSAYEGTAFEDDAVDAAVDWSSRWEVPNGRAKPTEEELMRAAEKVWRHARPNGGISAGTARMLMSKLPELAPKIASFTLAPFEPTALAKIQTMSWLYGTHYLRGALSMTAAPGGLGKSLLAIGEALSMATGQPLLGARVYRPLRVWYLSGEESELVLQQRINAAMHRHALSANDLNGRFFATSASELRALIGAAPRLVTETRSGPLVDEQLRTTLLTFLKENQIDVLIIDPLKKFHSVNENDNTGMDEVASTLAQIADEADIALEVVHHATKEARKGNSSSPANNSRGASALVDAARSARILEPLSKEDAGNWGVESPEQFVRIVDAKANNAKTNPRSRSRWFEKVSVALDNGTADYPDGDEVGVAVLWSPPRQEPENALAERYEALNALLELGSEGDLRKSDRSPDWIGHLLAGALRWDIGAGFNRSERNRKQETNRSKIRRHLADFEKGKYLIVEKRKARNGDDRPIYRIEREKIRAEIDEVHQLHVAPLVSAPVHPGTRE